MGGSVLRELTRADWLSILGIPEQRIPRALLLRGTRNVKAQYQHYRQFFSDVRVVGCPNGIIEDVFLGDQAGQPVAYASVYGGAMASEVVHIFGVLGTSLVIQTGCCGALADEIEAGDLFVPTEAFCGEGASQYYQPDARVVHPCPHPAEITALNAVTEGPIHQGRLFTTAALLGEGEREIEDWFNQGYTAVDMETATVFAVAAHFGMDRLAILFAFDNPRKRRHILLGHEKEVIRRRRGNERMIQVALEVIRDYRRRWAGHRRCTEGLLLAKASLLNGLEATTSPWGAGSAAPDRPQATGHDEDEGTRHSAPLPGCERLVRPDRRLHACFLDGRHPPLAGAGRNADRPSGRVPGPVPFRLLRLLRRCLLVGGV
jgi:5'-methylthioadenosine phosphorylase